MGRLFDEVLCSVDVGRKVYCLSATSAVCQASIAVVGLSLQTVTLANAWMMDKALYGEAGGA